MSSQRSKKVLIRNLIGEVLGTFILVFIGCGSIGVAIFTQAFTSLFQIATIWGLGVAVAIYVSRNMGPAHLNPAVSFSMCLTKRLEWSRFPLFVLSQMIGAMLAALLLFLLFEDSLLRFEHHQGVVRGRPESIRTAMMYGEFFPNPDFKDGIQVSFLMAMFAEALGTALLVVVILQLSQSKTNVDQIGPLVIGFTVTVIICIVAPFTQAGLNPARDFGPRIIAFLAGWGNASLALSWFHSGFVYVVGPILGATFASLPSLMSADKK